MTMDAEVRLSVQEIPPVSPTETELTQDTATAAIATGVPEGGCFLTVECSVAFNISFGGEDVGDPAAHPAFVPGSRRYWVDKTMTHYKITASAAGFASSYRSSR
jgi:hypothetical protein